MCGHRASFVVVSFALVGAGCAGDPGDVGPVGPAGPAGEAGATGAAGANGVSCTITDSGGARLLTCTDGTSVTLPADGGDVGRVEGRLVAIGGGVVDGVPVTLAGMESYTVNADAAGHYAFSDLPVGVYRLVVTPADRPRLERNNLLVLPGTHVVPDLTLLGGAFVTERTDARLAFAGADGATAGLVLPSRSYDGSQELWGWSAAEPELVPLAGDVGFVWATRRPDWLIVSHLESTVIELVSLSAGTAEPVVDRMQTFALGDDGSAVLFSHSADSNGRLQLTYVSLVDGTARLVASEVYDGATLTPNGRYVVYARDDGATPVLEAWDATSGTTTHLMDDVLMPGFSLAAAGDVVAMTFLRDWSNPVVELALIRLAAMSVTPLGDEPVAWAFDPTGANLFFQLGAGSPTPGLHRCLTSTGACGLIDEQASSPGAFAAGATRLLYAREVGGEPDPELRVIDLAIGSNQQVLAAGTTQLAISRGGGHALVMPAGGGAVHWCDLTGTPSCTLDGTVSELFGGSALGAPDDSSLVFAGRNVFGDAAPFHLSLAPGTLGQVRSMGAANDSPAGYLGARFLMIVQDGHYVEVIEPSGATLLLRRIAPSAFCRAGDAAYFIEKTDDSLRLWRVRATGPAEIVDPFVSGAELGCSPGGVIYESTGGQGWPRAGTYLAR